MNLSRWMDRVGFVGTSGGILASGAVQALGVLTVRIEIVSIVFVVGLLHAALSSIMVAVFVSLCGLVFGVKLARDHQSPTIQTDGDHVTAIVPVYEDAQVLDRCIQSLLNSCYDKLSVCIVCEPDDSASQRYAQSLATHDQIEVLVNTTNPGSKAGAINHAVDRTTSKYIAAFDADERVAPEFIGHAVANLDEYKIVQGRTVPEPTGAIEAVAYYESVLLSYVSRRVLYVLSEFRMASSRALVMHRTAFQEVGGYDAEMLTEDYAFAYRCYMDRVPVLETVAYPSRIKAAHTLRDWWGQRKRWMTGYVQVLHHLGSDLNPRDYRSVLSLVICAGTIIGNVLMLSLLSKFLVLLIIGAEAWFLPPVGAVLAVTLSVRLFDVRTSNIGRPGVYWLVTPALFPLYGLAMVKAAFEYVLTWEDEWYSVEKDIK